MDSILVCYYHFDICIQSDNVSRISFADNLKVVTLSKVSKFSIHLEEELVLVSEV